MHGSTRKMVDRLIGALVDRGVTAYRFDLASSDIGKLAVSLVDAATLVVGTPTVHAGPHPNAVYAAVLANALRPKVRFASVIGSYGWSTKAVEAIASMIPNLKVEIIPPRMTVAIGRWMSDPMPPAKAAGRMPRRATTTS